MAISKEQHLRRGSESWPHVLILAYLVGFSLLVPFTLSPEGRLQVGSSVSVPKTQGAEKVVDTQLEDMRGWAKLRREVRFPSTEQRLKIYLGNWFESCGPKFRFQRYNETMMLVEEHSGRLLEVFSRPETDGLFWLEPSVLEHCSASSWVLAIYCTDSLSLIRARKPVLMQFGDAMDPKGFGPVDVPIVKKSRPRLEYFGGCPALERREAILWKLNSDRHFGKLQNVTDHDLPWEKKKAVAVFRGALTGISQDGLSQANGDYNNCMISRRCRLVYKNDKSPLIDARLINHKYVQEIISAKINGIDIFGDSISVIGHLQYKALIMLEGNDVSSGLKWALYSNSVVLMPRPQHTTWAMEELLEEWVHYIPLDDDLENLQTQMEWVVANDEKANAIAQRGKAWIHDLLFAEHAEEENAWIEEETMRLLSNHFEETNELATQLWSEDSIGEEDEAQGLGAGAQESVGNSGGISPRPKPVAKPMSTVEAAPEVAPASIPTPGASPGTASAGSSKGSEIVPKADSLVEKPATPGVNGRDTTSAGSPVAMATPGPQSASAQAETKGDAGSPKDRASEAKANSDTGSKDGPGVDNGAKKMPSDVARGPQYQDTADEALGEAEKDTMSWSNVEGKDKR